MSYDVRPDLCVEEMFLDLKEKTPMNRCDCGHCSARTVIQPTLTHVDDIVDNPALLHMSIPGTDTALTQTNPT